MQNDELSFPRTNNIDLLRLIAALQVVLVHGFAHLIVVGEAGGIVLAAMSFLPGVPLFFFLSGLLISPSYERASSIWSYTRNRVLRLDPGLWVCIAISVALIVGTGFLEIQRFLSPRLLAWLLTQGSFLQFYNPPELAQFGIGVINGSLWTISVEIQFYILMPLLAALLRYRWLYILVFLTSLFTNLFMSQFGGSFFEQHVAGKLLKVSFVPWVYMFMTGQLAYKYWDLVRHWFEGKWSVWIAIFVGCAGLNLLLKEAFGISFGGNDILPVGFFSLAGLALAKPGLSERILGGNDLSYGSYIYHMPIINTLLYLGISFSTWSFVYMLGLVILTAFLSWTLVERPALRLKSYSIKPR